MVDPADCGRLKMTRFQSTRFGYGRLTAYNYTHLMYTQVRLSPLPTHTTHQHHTPHTHTHTPSPHTPRTTHHTPASSAPARWVAGFVSRVLEGPGHGLRVEMAPRPRCESHADCHPLHCAVRVPVRTCPAGQRRRFGGRRVPHRPATTRALPRPAVVADGCHTSANIAFNYNHTAAPRALVAAARASKGNVIQIPPLCERSK